MDREQMINEKALGVAYEVLDKNVICGEGPSLDDFSAAITAYLAALEAAGVVMVPLDPTEAQRAAGEGTIDQYSARHLILVEDREAMAVAAYGAMLAAKDAT